MKQEYRNKIDFIKETVRDVLDEFVKHHNKLHYEDLAPYQRDFNGLAKSISNSNNWDNYYRNIFKRDLQVRQYLFEMCDTRHLFSHRDGEKELNEEDVFRTANTAIRLLNSIDLDAAKVAKEEILEIERTYGSRLYRILESENDAHQHLTDTDDVREPQEEVAQENEIQEFAETTTEIAATSDEVVSDNVENRELSRNYINRRYELDDNYNESPKKVVESELQRMRAEDARKKMSTRSNFDRARSSYNSPPKQKRPYNNMPESSSKGTDSQNQIPAWVYPAVIAALVILVPIIQHAIQGNIVAFIILALFLVFGFLGFRRIMDHLEYRLWLESEQNKSFFQKVREWIRNIIRI